ncbi:MAG: M56 family metallopeptidase, partial [Planctomycetota bacterium]
VYGILFLLKMRGASQPYQSKDDGAWLLHWSATTGNDFSIGLQESPVVASPCVTLLFGNEIFVPRGFQSWSISDRQTALAHEFAHIVRRDALWRMIAEFLRFILCLHPLSHRLCRQIVLAQELATDHDAARLFEEKGRYRHDLAKLALRLDEAEHRLSPTFVVSVSTNDLIRRIKMLKSISLPIKAWQKRLAVASLLLASCSVSLVTTADDTPRIASLPEVGRIPTDDYFLRNPSMPWDHIGPSDTYLRVATDQLRGSSSYRELVQRALSSLMQDAEFFPAGSFVDNWSLFESNLSIEIRKLAQPAENGHEWALFQSANSIRMEFEQAVDWSSVVNAIEWDNLGPPENETTQGMRQLMDSVGTSHVLDMVSKSTDESVEDPNLAKQCWKSIDGGVVGAVWRVDNSFKTEDVLQSEKDKLFQTLQLCETLGL